MLTDLSMVLILCGKLLRKWASEFEWGMWRNIEWGIGIGVTVVGVLGIAAASVSYTHLTLPTKLEV